MAGSVIFEEQVEIPLDLHALADFRRWALSDECPERGRIDYIAGRIEVDMSPEDLFTHGTLKTELIRALGQRIKEGGLGHLFSDCTRVSCPAADLSAEPDIVFVSHEAIAKGRVTLIPKASGEEGRFVELEGPPDLIVEIVSDASKNKDLLRLPKAYFDAGVREFWLSDARGEELVFQLHRPGRAAFEPVAADAEGFKPPAVLQCSYRLERRRDRQGLWTFDLLEK